MSNLWVFVPVASWPSSGLPLTIGATVSIPRRLALATAALLPATLVIAPAAGASAGNPASAIRAGNVSMIASRSALSIRCQRAISGSVRPQPKQRLVLGSIMQTAMHGVSMLMQGY